VRDDAGIELNAEFSVVHTAKGFDVFLESRGGVIKSSGQRRNADYNLALTLLLTRMAAVGLSVGQAYIASSKTFSLTPEERRLDLRDYRYPVQLASMTDFEALRLNLGGALAKFQAGPDSKGKGTSAKRLNLSVLGPGLSGMTSDAFARLLASHADRGGGMRDVGLDFTSDHQGHEDAGHTPVWTEAPTADPEALAASVQALRRKLKSSPAPKAPPAGSPGGRQIVGQTVRYVRDPNVIVWVHEGANGHCEVCEQPAPFAREDGSPYLEVHHMRPLGEGGPDTVDNAVAACPNCHRRLHHGEDRLDARDQTIARICRLVDYPEVPVISATALTAGGAGGRVSYSAA